MLRFRLFGIDVEVMPWFWVMAVLLGWRPGSFDDSAGRIELFTWVPVVFVSVLVHELGHAFAIKRHRIEPNIRLHSLGGTTYWRAPARMGRLQHVIIDVAGPFAGFALALVTYLALRFAP